jgi:hypothetical protein
MQLTIDSIPVDKRNFQQATVYIPWEYLILCGTLV